MQPCEITPQQVEQYRQELVRRERSLATVGNYIRHCGEFLRFCRAAPCPSSAPVSPLQDWKHSLLAAGLCPATINAKLAAVNGFLRFLGRPELCVRQVRRQRRVFRDKDRDLTRGEYLRLVQTARAQGRERLCLAMQTICATGIRVSELRFITVEAVRTGRATVTGKGKCREILLPGALRQKLKRYLKGLGRWTKCGDYAASACSSPVFLTAGGQPLDRSNLWREMRSLCAAAKVDPHKVFPHNLRHLFAKTFYTLNKDIAKLAELLGHASIETTRIYIMETGAAHARLLEGCTYCYKKRTLQQNQRFVVAGTAHNANTPAPVLYRGVFCVDLILMKIRQTDQQEAVALPVLFKLPIYRGFTLIGLNSHFYCAIIGIYLSSCANPYRMTC